MCRKGVSEYSVIFAANYSASCRLPQCRNTRCYNKLRSKRNGLLHIRPTRELQEDIFQPADIVLHQLSQFFFGP